MRARQTVLIVLWLLLGPFARYVDDRVTIAILMNTDDADDSVVAQGVARLHLPASTPG